MPKTKVQRTRSAHWKKPSEADYAAMTIMLSEAKSKPEVFDSDEPLHHAYLLLSSTPVIHDINGTRDLPTTLPDGGSVGDFVATEEGKSRLATLLAKHAQPIKLTFSNFCTENDIAVDVSYYEGSLDTVPEEIHVARKLRASVDVTAEDTTVTVPLERFTFLPSDAVETEFTNRYA